MKNLFVNRSGEGRSDWPWYILSLLVIWITFLIIGGIPLVVGMFSATGMDPEKLSEILRNINKEDIPYMDEKVFFVLLMMQFVLGLVAVLISVRFIHNRKMGSCISGFSPPRWMRAIQAMLLCIGLTMVLGVALSLMDPGIFVYQDNMRAFLKFLPLIIIFIPLQCAFEELAVRGFLLQWLAGLFKNRKWIAAVITAALFATLHLANPEMSENNPMLMYGFYFLFGLLLALVALVDEGMELAIGIHTANNLFSFLFVSYEGAAIHTPALFHSGKPSMVIELIGIILIFSVVWLVFLRGKMGNFIALFKPSGEENRVG